MDTDVLFSSNHQEWETPQDLFDILNNEFKFTLDAAASSHNSKCLYYLDEEVDALTKPWVGRVFLNPPYGRMIGTFIEKAYREAQENAEIVVCLIPARTDTAYWHDFVMKSLEIRLIRGRVKFGVMLAGQKLSFSCAPFPSAIVVFSKGNWKPEISSFEFGRDVIEVENVLDDIPDLDNKEI